MFGLCHSDALTRVREHAASLGAIAVQVVQRPLEAPRAGVQRVATNVAPIFFPPTGAEAVEQLYSFPEGTLMAFFPVRAREGA